MCNCQTENISSLLVRIFIVACCEYTASYYAAVVDQYHTFAALHQSTMRLRMYYQLCNTVLRYPSARSARKHAENVYEYAAVNGGNHTLGTAWAAK
jgi:hypothetical protein